MNDFNQQGASYYGAQGQQPQYPYIGFGDAISICFSKYATFSGRAGRAEFWWWMLFNFLVSVVFTTAAGLFNGSFLGTLFTWFNGAVSIALLIPSLAVAWRRLHDLGKGGGWYFINLIPLVGSIIYIVWCCQRGEQYPNRFGDPVA